MGMYTQVRGWLNIDSIGYENKKILQNKLLEAQTSFEDEKLCDRSWICRNTILHMGGNGSAFLFIGAELKNYDMDAEKWIEYLLKFFPNAEGRIDFQYEEDEEECEYWLIRDGFVLHKGYNAVWCEGYGNCNKLTHNREQND